MLELYTAYTTFLANSHWSVALLIHVVALLANIPLARGFAHTLTEGKITFPLWLLAITAFALPLVYPCAMFSSWVTFGIWTPDSWSWFYVVMGVIWVAMQVASWTVIRSATNEDAS